MILQTAMPASFRARLMFLVTSTLVLTVVTICALQLWLNFAGVKERAPVGVGTRAAVLAASVEASLTFDDPQAAQARLDALRADSGVGEVAVYRQSGELFASYRKPGGNAPQVGPVGPSREFRGKWVVVRVPIERAGERLGTIALEYDLGGVYRQFWQAAALSILAAFVVVAIALLVAARVGRQLTGPLADLAGIATRVSRTGDYGLRADGSDIEELQGLAVGFNTMMSRIDTQSQELEAARDHLEQRVAERTAESERRATQLRALAVELSQTEERERRRLAYALHDGLQQLLVAAEMRLAHVGELHDAPPHEAVSMSKELIQEAIAASRSLTTELVPPVLYVLGLADALRWLASTCEADTGLRVHLEIEPLEELAEPIKGFLFRSVKELLFNVVKHSGVQEATLRIRQGDEQLILSVEDEGRGFDLAAYEQNVVRGFGLFSISERLGHLGGRLEVRSAVEGRTSVTLHVPRKPVQLAYESGASAAGVITTQDVRVPEKAP